RSKRDWSSDVCSSDVGHGLTGVREAGVAGGDVCQSGGREQAEDHPDEDAVVAAVVVSAQEQADGIAGEDHGQGEGHTPEGAFDDTADAIAHGTGNVPPFEGGDDDRESDEEEGSAVSLRR